MRGGKWADETEEALGPLEILLQQKDAEIERLRLDYERLSELAAGYEQRAEAAEKHAAQSDDARYRLHGELEAAEAKVRELQRDYDNAVEQWDFHVGRANKAEAELAAAREENLKLQDAIAWAMGEFGEFRHRREGEGAFWWRKELRLRAALRAEPAPPLKHTRDCQETYNVSEGSTGCICGAEPEAAAKASEGKVNDILDYESMQAEIERLRELSVWGTAENVGEHYDRIRNLEVEIERLRDSLRIARLQRDAERMRAEAAEAKLAEAQAEVQQLMENKHPVCLMFDQMEAQRDEARRQTAIAEHRAEEAEFHARESKEADRASFRAWERSEQDLAAERAKTAKLVEALEAMRPPDDWEGWLAEDAYDLARGQVAEALAAAKASECDCEQQGECTDSTCWKCGRAAKASEGEK